MRERERENEEFGSFWKRPEFDTSIFIGPLIELFKKKNLGPSFGIQSGPNKKLYIKTKIPLELRAKNWAMGKL